MDQIEILADGVVHLARLSLSGRNQDVQDYLMRLSRKLRKLSPALSEELAKLLSQNPTRQMPTRGATLAAIPVDSDSRHQLLRFDPVPGTDYEPVWDDVVAAQLDQIVAEHLREADLLAAGLAPTRTAVFTGPPGVGKTLAAKIIARRIGRPLLTLDLAAVISSFLGRTGTNVRNVLDYAKGVECVLLLDEIDALAKRRDDSHEVGELKRLVTVLLQEVDDWPPGGLLIAATNHANLLDPAIWRRFEMRVEFPMPDRATMRAAVSTHLRAGDLVADHWAEILSIALAKCSFSDVAREISGARRRALVAGIPLQEVLEQVISKHANEMSKSDLKGLARQLYKVGVSQHQVRRLTGLSRDTIRLACEVE
jgi:SpoVK/Ycf46/Vps4 family AAA+-type ATPase